MAINFNHTTNIIAYDNGAGQSGTFVNSEMTGNFLTCDINIANIKCLTAGCSNCLCNSTNSSILGGCGNAVCLSENSSILDGCCNIIRASYESSILGGKNQCLCDSSTSSILGGCKNQITNSSCSVSILAGCCNNICASLDSAIAGGCCNIINNSCNSFVGVSTGSFICCSTGVSILGSCITVSGINNTVFVNNICTSGGKYYGDASALTGLHTGDFITTGMTGAFGANGSVDLSNYVTKNATGDFITTGMTGALTGLTGSLVSTAMTGALTGLTGNLTNVFASLNGGYLTASQIPNIYGDVCINAGSNSSTVYKIQGYPIINTQPVNGQTLQFNGTSWVPGDIAAGGNGGGGLIYYFNETVAADLPTGNLPYAISGIYELGRSGIANQFSVETPNLPTDNYTGVVGFITDTIDPSTTAIPAGLFDFNFWASSNGATETVIKFEVYKYNGTDATLLKSSDDIYAYDGAISAQYVASIILPQTTVVAEDRLYVRILAKGLTQNKRVTFYFGGNTPSHVHTTVPSVGGSGLVKVINGIMQKCASKLVDDDVCSSAAIAGTKIQSNYFALVSNTGCFVTTGMTGSLTGLTGTLVSTDMTGNFDRTFTSNSGSCNFGGNANTIISNCNSCVFSNAITNTIFNTIISSSGSCLSGNCHNIIASSIQSQICSGACFNSIIGSYNSCILTGAKYSSIIGGCINCLCNCADRSVILGGCNNKICCTACNSSILAGCSITATCPNTAHATNFCACAGAFFGNGSGLISGVYSTNATSCNLGNTSNIIISNCNSCILQNNCFDAIISSSGSCLSGNCHNMIFASNRAIVCSGSCFNSIGNSYNSCILTGVKYSSILGGCLNVICNCGQANAIIGGYGNIICCTAINSSVIAGSGIVAACPNTTYSNNFCALSGSFFGKLISESSNCFTNTGFLLMNGSGTAPTGCAFLNSPIYGNGYTLSSNDEGLFLGRTQVSQHSFCILESSIACEFNCLTGYSTDLIITKMSANGKYSIIAPSTGVSGYLYSSCDYLNTFTKTNFSGCWTSLAMSADGKVNYATSSNGNIYVSYDYGKNWSTRLTDIGNKNWTSIATSADGRFVTAVGEATCVYSSCDYGTTFTGVYAADSYSSNRMSADARVQLVIAYNGGYANSRALLSYDYGNSWISKTITSAYMAEVSSDGRIQAIVGYNYGNIWMSYDYGNSWCISSADQAFFVGISMACNGKVILAASSTYVQVSTNYGCNWTYRAAGPYGNWYSPSLSNDGKYFMTSYSLDVGASCVYTSTGITYTNTDICSCGKFYGNATSMTLNNVYNCYGNFSLNECHESSIIRFTGATAGIICITNTLANYNIGSTTTVLQGGAGQVSISGVAGQGICSISLTNKFKTSASGAVVRATKLATNVWMLDGDLI